MGEVWAKYGRSMGSDAAALNFLKDFYLFIYLLTLF